LKNKQDIKKNNLLQLGIGLIILILLNLVGFRFFTRMDLTSEKRYTLSEPTKKMLRDLDDIVFFQVYLDGDFPAGFKRLRRETREMLDQFRAYSDKIQYEFINPSSSDDQQERNAVYRRLVERGLNPTDLQVKSNEGTSQLIIFPGAIVSYLGKEFPMELLVSQMGVPPEEALNNSIQNLEFNMANTIRKLSVQTKPKLAFIEGHGELDALQTADITRSLREYYLVDRISMDGQLNSLTEREELEDGKVLIRNKYHAIVIAKPEKPFDEKDKFIIDQFVMRGGTVLWLIDPVYASMDSIQFADATVGIINDLNLSDQLFNYGVRLNTNLVMDLSALPIPMQTGEVGGTPQYNFFPWYYFPVLHPLIDHPIVKNLNAIKTEFIGSLDTISKQGITKTVLLTSSELSRTVNTPVLISIDILLKEPDRRLYQKKHIPVAVLLEGSFESLYKNRVPPEIRESSEIGFISESKPAKMIVVADGDIIKNQIRQTGGRLEPYPLGFDLYTSQTFGNKEFILNAINYLVEEDGLISIRSRELKLRLLDQSKVRSEKLKWQVINTGVPVLVIFILGFIMFFMRKMKYS
jgi:ABC-2 type transport system permease protein